MAMIKQVVLYFLVFALMLSLGIPAAAAEEDDTVLKNGTYKNVLIDRSAFGHGFIMGAVFKEEHSFASVAEQDLDDPFAELSYVVNGKTKKMQVILLDLRETTGDEYEIRVIDAISSVGYTGTVIDGMLELTSSDGTEVKGSSAKIKLGKTFGAELTDKTVIYNGSNLKEKLTISEVSDMNPRYAIGSVTIRDEAATQVIFKERVAFEGDFWVDDEYYVLNNGTYKDVTLFSIIEEDAYFAAEGIFWGKTVSTEELYRSEMFPDCLELTFTAKNKTHTYQMYHYGTDYLEETGEYIINGQTFDGGCWTATIRDHKINLTDHSGTEISGKSLKIRTGMQRPVLLSDECTIYNGTDKKETLSYDELNELMAYAELSAVNSTMTSRFGKIRSIVIRKKIDGLKELRAANGEQTGNDVPYKIRVEDATQEIYSGPGCEYDVVRTFGNRGTFTIVEEAWDQNGELWGKLKSGVGWVALAEVQP